jgi:hypothetical protein
MRTKKDIKMLLESGLSSAFVANLNDSQMKSLVERFGRDKKITVIKNSELKDKVKHFIKKYSKIKDIENIIDDWSDENLVDKIKGYAKRANSGSANKMADDLYKQIEKSLKDSKKEETKEDWQKNVSQEVTYTTPVSSASNGKGVQVPPPADPTKKTMVSVSGGNLKVTQAEGEVSEDDTLNVVNDPDATSDGMPTTEGVIREEFESKAQQGFFWAKCNTSKGVKKKKWCELAREFSDSTSKKQYKKMPEKLHPEKTVKQNSEKIDEKYEQFLENKIVEMIERHVDPKMTKGDILKTISEKIEKNNSMMLKNPKKMSMFAHESGIESKKMKKPTQMMPVMGTMEENETKEKERTKEKDAPTKPGTPPKRRGNPFKDPNPGVKEKPRGEKKNKEKMKQDFIGLIKQAFE